VTQLTGKKASGKSTFITGVQTLDDGRGINGVKDGNEETCSHSLQLGRATQTAKRSFTGDFSAPFFLMWFGTASVDGSDVSVHYSSVLRHWPGRAKRQGSKRTARVRAWLVSMCIRYCLFVSSSLIFCFFSEVSGEG